MGTAVASAGPYANNLHSTSLQSDNNTDTSSLNFYRPDALPDAPPTRQSTEGGQYGVEKLGGFCEKKKHTCLKPIA